MKKSLILGVLLVLNVVIFSGCSQQQVAIKKSDNGVVRMAAHNYDEHSGVYKSVSGNKDVHIKYLFQENAEYTLYSGARYFRIIKPMDSSSQLMTTAQELHDKCFDHNIFANFIGSDFCVYIKGHVAMDTIQVYKDKPKDVLVFDAQEVIDYLKVENLYVDTSEMYESVNKKFATAINPKLKY